MGFLEQKIKYKDKRDALLQEMRDIYYWHVHRLNNGKNEPRWRDVHMVKFPTDLIMYAEAIFQNKPDWIIETGTRYGGSALFLADMLSLIDAPGKVVTIDIKKQWTKTHPKIEYIEGSSVDPKVIETVKGMVSGKVMAVLDSDHSARHVKRELRYMSNIVTPGQFIIVEDCYTKKADPFPPKRAVDWFLNRVGNRFVQEPREDKYLFAVSRYGWLRRVR